jgi:hypothetical protein
VILVLLSTRPPPRVHLGLVRSLDSLAILNYSMPLVNLYHWDLALLEGLAGLIPNEFTVTHRALFRTTVYWIHLLALQTAQTAHRDLNSTQPL